MDLRKKQIAEVLDEENRAKKQVIDMMYKQAKAYTMPEKVPTTKMQVDMIKFNQTVDNFNQSLQEIIDQFQTIDTSSGDVAKDINFIYINEYNRIMYMYNDPIWSRSDKNVMKNKMSELLNNLITITDFWYQIYFSNSNLMGENYYKVFSEYCVAKLLRDNIQNDIFKPVSYDDIKIKFNSELDLLGKTSKDEILKNMIKVNPNNKQNEALKEEIKKLESQEGRKLSRKEVMNLAIKIRGDDLFDPYLGSSTSSKTPSIPSIPSSASSSVGPSSSSSAPSTFLQGMQSLGSWISGLPSSLPDDTYEQPPLDQEDEGYEPPLEQEQEPVQEEDEDDIPEINIDFGSARYQELTDVLEEYKLKMKDLKYDWQDYEKNYDYIMNRIQEEDVPESQKKIWRDQKNKLYEKERKRVDKLAGVYTDVINETTKEIKKRDSQASQGADDEEELSEIVLNPDFIIPNYHNLSRDELEKEEAKLESYIQDYDRTLKKLRDRYKSETNKINNSSASKSAKDKKRSKVDEEYKKAQKGIIDTITIHQATLQAIRERLNKDILDELDAQMSIEGQGKKKKQEQHEMMKKRLIRDKNYDYNDGNNDVFGVY